MKRKLSVPALWVRMTFRGAVGILIVSLCAQLLLFRLRLSGAAAGEAAFSDVVEGAFVKYVYRASFALMFFWIFRASRASFLTTARLDVSEASLAMWHAAVTLGWFVILMAAQTGAVLIGYRWFLGAADPAAVGGQTLVIACYENRTLHSLLPLSDWLLFADVLLLHLALAFSMAVDVHTMRRGGRFPALSGVLAATVEILIGGGVLEAEAEASWLYIAEAAVIAAAQMFRLTRSALEEAA